MYNIEYAHIDNRAYPFVVLNIYLHYPKDISIAFFEIT